MSGDELQSALAERDRILIALDQSAAKEFIVKHGGKAPENLNYELVLHMARHEVTLMPENLHMDSKIYLARSGHYGLAMEPPKSQYARAALDLIFPRVMTDQFIEQHADELMSDPGDPTDPVSCPDCGQPDGNHTETCMS